MFNLHHHFFESLCGMGSRSLSGALFGDAAASILTNLRKSVLLDLVKKVESKGISFHEVKPHVLLGYK
jgi:hypothetical protein